MLMFVPFDRKRVLMTIDELIQKHYGSYKELITLTIKDLNEINIVLESKEAEEKLAGYT